MAYLLFAWALAWTVTDAAAAATLALLTCALGAFAGPMLAAFLPAGENYRTSPVCCPHDR